MTEFIIDEITNKDDRDRTARLNENLTRIERLLGASPNKRSSEISRRREVSLPEKKIVELPKPR